MYAVIGSSAGNYGPTIETWGDESHGMVADNSTAESSGAIGTHGVGSYGMYALNGGMALNHFR